MSSLIADSRCRYRVPSCLWGERNNLSQSSPRQGQTNARGSKPQSNVSQMSTFVLRCLQHHQEQNHSHCKFFAMQGSQGICASTTVTIPPFWDEGQKPGTYCTLVTPNSWCLWMFISSHVGFHRSWPMARSTATALELVAGFPEHLATSPQRRKVPKIWHRWKFQGAKAPLCETILNQSYTCGYGQLWLQNGMFSATLLKPKMAKWITIHRNICSPSHQSRVIFCHNIPTDNLRRSNL